MDAVGFQSTAARQCPSGLFAHLSQTVVHRRGSPYREHRYTCETKTRTKGKMNFVRIHTSWAFDGVEFQNCPACGAEVLANATPCEHLLFNYFDEAGEFSSIADSVRDTIDAATTHREKLEDDDPVEAEDLYLPEEVARRLDRESAICIAFGANTTGGGYTVAIDFEG